MVLAAPTWRTRGGPVASKCEPNSSRTRPAERPLTRSEVALLLPEGIEVGAQPSEQFRRTEFRLDLERSLRLLDPDDVALCLQLAEYAPTEICRSANMSRAGVYRRIKAIRMHMLTTGLVAAACAQNEALK